MSTPIRLFRLVETRLSAFQAPGARMLTVGLLLGLWAAGTGVLAAQEPAATAPAGHNQILIIRGGQRPVYTRQAPIPSTPAGPSTPQGSPNPMRQDGGPYRLPSTTEPGYFQQQSQPSWDRQGTLAPPSDPATPPSPARGSHPPTTGDTGTQASTEGTVEPETASRPSRESGESRADDRPIRETIVIREAATPPPAEPASRNWVQLGFEQAVGVLVGLVLCLLLLLVVFLMLIRRLVDRSAQPTVHNVYQSGYPPHATGPVAPPVAATGAQTSGDGSSSTDESEASPAPRPRKPKPRPTRKTAVVDYDACTIPFDSIRAEFDEKREEIHRELSQEESAIMESIIAENALLTTRLGAMKQAA